MAQNLGITYAFAGIRIGQLEANDDETQISLLSEVGALVSFIISEDGEPLKSGELEQGTTHLVTLPRGVYTISIGHIVDLSGLSKDAKVALSAKLSMDESEDWSRVVGFESETALTIDDATGELFVGDQKVEVGAEGSEIPCDDEHHG